MAIMFVMGLFRELITHGNVDSDLTGRMSGHSVKPTIIYCTCQSNVQQLIESNYEMENRR